MVSISTPMRRKFVSMVAMRSVSLTRNSPASRTVKPLTLARSEHGQRGNFVDQRRGQRAFDDSSGDARGPDAQVADQFAAALLHVEHFDLRAHADQKIEQRGTGRDSGRRRG